MALTSLTPLGKSKQNQPHTQMDSIWSNNNNSHIQHNDDNHSWEVRAFEEDTASNLLGCTWPPRSYTCTFCRREFRSAQALGGHMNVHRRDRARQLQPLAAPPPEFSANANAFCLHYRLPNPNSIPFPIPIHFSSPLPDPATAKPSDTTPNSVVSSVCTEPSPSSSNDNHRENAVVEEELDLELRLGRRQSQGTP